MLTGALFLTSTVVHYGIEVPFTHLGFVLSLLLTVSWVVTSYFFGYAKPGGYAVLCNFYFGLCALVTAATIVFMLLDSTAGLYLWIAALLMYGFSLMGILLLLPNLGVWSMTLVLGALVLIYLACLFSFRMGRRRFQKELAEKRAKWKPVEYS